MKEYICPRWPEYSLSGKVKFVGGWFRTDELALQELIESNDQFGVRIWDASGEAHHGKETISAPETSGETEAGSSGETLRREVSDDGQSGEGGFPTLQQDPAGSPAGASAPLGGGRDAEGRETGHVFQELEEIVRGSGIIGSEGGEVKPGSRKKGKE
jgi:hypothetical protein